MLVNQIVFEEPLISENRKPQLRRLVYKLIEKLETNETEDFYLFKASGGRQAAVFLLFCIAPQTPNDMYLSSQI